MFKKNCNKNNLRIKYINIKIIKMNNYLYHIWIFNRTYKVDHTYKSTAINIIIVTIELIVKWLITGQKSLKINKLIN